MFFGRKNEKFEADQLEALLNESFEKKLGSFRTRSEGIASELRDAQGMFRDACDRLDELGAEPNMENLFWMSASHIKKQKGSYTKALKNTVDKFVLEPEDSANSYDRYEALFSVADEMNREILKTNAAFKQVLYCYSHHLGDFKRASLYLERLLLMLRAELDKRSKEYQEYTSLGDNISKLRNYKEELVALRSSINALEASMDSKDNSQVNDNKEGVSEKLRIKREEYAAVDRDGAALSNMIYLLLSPLSRASKKFDHLVARKRHLNSFIEDPFGYIRSEADYKEFRSLILELKESVESGVIDVKNRDEVNEKIGEILASDLHYQINSFGEMQNKKSIISEEIRVLDRVISRIVDAKKSVEMRAAEIKDMEKNIENINTYISTGKSTIEKQFLQYYGRSVSIV